MKYNKTKPEKLETNEKQYRMNAVILGIHLCNVILETESGLLEARKVSCRESKQGDREPQFVPRF